MPRTLEGIERRKAQDRERKRKKYESDDGFRNKEIERRKTYYTENRAQEVARKKEQYERDKDRRLTKRKEWSAKHPERQLETQRAWYGRQPPVAIGRVGRALRHNRMGVDEAHRLVSDALARQDAYQPNTSGGSIVRRPDGETVEVEARCEEVE